MAREIKKRCQCGTLRTPKTCSVGLNIHGKEYNYFQCKECAAKAQREKNWNKETITTLKKRRDKHLLDVFRLEEYIVKRARRNQELLRKEIAEGVAERRQQVQS